MHCIVLGASRGLGAALVGELLSRGHVVIALARSGTESMADHDAWSGTGRFHYHQVDVSDPASRGALTAIRDSLPRERICIVLNAALVESDVTPDGGFLPDVYDRVSRVGVTPLGLVVDIFSGHLRAYGGMLVGISSLSAWAPPFLEPRIAYPASKSFLTMALRSLRIVWGGRVKIVTVFLGNIGSRRFPNAPQWFIPSYETAARKIAARITGKRVPNTLLIPLPVALLYKGLSVLPDRIFYRLFLRLQWLLRMISGERGS